MKDSLPQSRASGGLVREPAAINVRAAREAKLAFPTPIWIVDLENLTELNASMRRALLGRESQARREGADFGENYPNGYTTYFDPQNLFETRPFDELARYILTVAQDFAAERGYDLSKRRLVMTQMFGNVQYQNSYHPYHHHQGSTFSGTYYVSAPRTPAIWSSGTRITPKKWRKRSRTERTKTIPKRFRSLRRRAAWSSFRLISTTWCFSISSQSLGSP